MKTVKSLLLGATLCGAQLSSAAIIDLTTGGPSSYTFDPGDGSSVTLTISVNTGSIHQNGQGLGIDSALIDDNALDNYASGASQETLTFTFSSLVSLDSLELDNFEPLLNADKHAEFSFNAGGISAIDDNNMTDLGFSNWRYDVNEDVTSFTIGTPARSGIIGDTSFRINNIVVSAIPSVPVPAAAWLFGSALLGMGVVRRNNG